MATKMEMLISDAKAFMTNFKTSTETNTSKANEVIAGLNTVLHKEKESLEECLATENSLMDDLATHTTTVKVTQANKDINELKSDGVVVKSCVGDVNTLLSNILDSHDPILAISHSQTSC